MSVPPSMIDFFDHFCAKPPIRLLARSTLLRTFLNESPHELSVLSRSAPMALFSENSGSQWIMITV